MRTLAMLPLLVLTFVIGCDGNDNRDESPAAMSTPTPAVTPTPRDTSLAIVGVYDTTVLRGGVTTDTIGFVTTLMDGSIFVGVTLSNDASARFAGPLAADGTLDGEGTLFVSDVGFEDTATATFADDAGTRTVTGSIVAPRAYDDFNEPIGFTMRRPADADASRFSGTYRFEFAASPSGCGCASTVDLTLTIAASGFGVVAGGTDRVHDGTSVGSVSSGFVSLSPRNRLRITAGYLPASPMPPFGGALALIGAVEATGDVVRASGDTFVGFTPDLQIGTWSAERVP